MASGEGLASAAHGDHVDVIVFALGKTSYGGAGGLLVADAHAGFGLFAAVDGLGDGGDPVAGDGGCAGTAWAGVQFTFRSPSTLAALTLVGPAGPDCRGPLGQPPIPGPPSSPNSAMVRPCRFPSASSSSHAMARSPEALAAISAVAGSLNT